jgi:hypothetical protein
MVDILADIKRIKLLGKIFLGLSNNKLILKDFENPDEHITILFKQNGIIDIHKTKEGSQKEYESIGIFDLVKTVQKILSDPTDFMNGIKAFAEGGKEITFEEPEFSDYSIVNSKSKEEFLSLFEKKKKDFVIPAESAGEFFPFKNTIPWHDAKDKVKETAFVLNKDGIMIGHLLKVHDKIFFFSIDVMQNQFVSKFISLMTSPEKADQGEQFDSKGQK